MRRSDRGFTLVEMCVASAVLATILLAGVVVSKAAMHAAQRAVVVDGTASRLDQAVDRIREELVDASLSTLQAIPAGGQVPENMKDAVAYDNFSFRRVTGVSIGAPAYSATERFFLATDARGVKSLEFDHATSIVVLVPEVTQLSFTKSGKEVVVQLSVAATTEHPAAAVATAVRLLVP